VDFKAARENLPARRTTSVNLAAVALDESAFFIASNALPRSGPSVIFPALLPSSSAVHSEIISCAAGYDKRGSYDVRGRLLRGVAIVVISILELLAIGGAGGIANLSGWAPAFRIRANGANGVGGWRCHNRT
jgi:hypothetical protein